MSFSAFRASRPSAALTARGAVILATAVVGIAATLLWVPPIAQWPEYHQLADQRRWLGIPNALDVLSSLLFVVVGAWGLVATGRWRCRADERALRTIYAVLFGAVLLTGFGSAYYHSAPDNLTLAWDRLPMGAGFVALLASVVGEMLDRRLALPLLLVAGIGSVLYWAWSETQGAGDLRAYGLVQFLPVPLILLIAALYPAPAGYRRHMFAVLGVFALSKLLELLDREIFAATGGLLSGHTLKHLAAAGAVLILLAWVRRR